MTAGVRWAASTDVGRARQLNEDSYYAGDRIFGVADGLGGHRAGEVASKIAVDLLEKLDKSKARNLASALEDCVRTANHEVYEHAAENPDQRGMGTTVTALAFENGTAHLAHVGDSRCYLLREGQISLVSRDHTLVARMVDEGSLTEEEASAHPQRSIVTRALGADEDVQIDTLELGLAAGDRLLLCSDGLSSVVPAGDITRLLSAEGDPQSACDKLIDEANRRGGPDNITVVLIDVAADAVPARAPQRQADRPAAATQLRTRKTRRRFFNRRLGIWLTAIVVVIGGGFIGMKMWLDRSWYVGQSEGAVSIFRGLPTDFVGLTLHHRVSKTTLTVEQVAPYYRERLAEGIRVPSLAEAQRIVKEVIPRATATVPGGSPSPTPSPTGSKT